ncbi:MAG: HAMP domain-containing sensor histidine kinase [Verrucomicrobiia bacterium]
MSWNANRALIHQSTTESTAETIRNTISDIQTDFGQQVEDLLADRRLREMAPEFNRELTAKWPWAEVGFVVFVDGVILSPSPLDGPVAKRFLTDNSLFLNNQETVEVYQRKTIEENKEKPISESFQKKDQAYESETLSENAQQAPVSSLASAPKMKRSKKEDFADKGGLVAKPKANIVRNVIPQKDLKPQTQAISQLESQEAEFRQIVGTSTQGVLARFLQNQLKLIMWYRSPRDPQLIFGTQLNLNQIREKIKTTIATYQPQYENGSEICLAVLDEKGKPIALSEKDYQTDWKRPFVATEIGEMLPHWEVAAYLLNPKKLNQSAQTLKLTISLIVVVLVLAIIVGGWLIFSDLHRQVKLARQKTDFVSNVSHELKTPLTSIRIFSELLTSGKTIVAEKQQSYLKIISSEANRLTRLINNILDFSRMERGEKNYDMQSCDLVKIVEDIVTNYKPHLEANGFQLNLENTLASCLIKADRDAIGQIILNLLSNAEKYGGKNRQIDIEISRPMDQSKVRISVKDRGDGVPKGCEEKIFEKFFRAHNSLNSGIQGSGLGLTLARRIARSHGGNIDYEPRNGGGSSFTLELPLENS